MTHLKKGWIVFLIFLFLISSAYAQNFDLFSGKFYELKEGEERIEFESFNGTYDICENEKKAIPILIVNNDAVDNKFVLDAFGVSWINLNVKEFLLSKKQRGIIFLQLAPVLDVEGKYAIKISTLSSANSRKDLILDVNVEKCYSLKLELEKEYDKACGGIKKQYRGEVINNGKNKVDVELNVNGPNWISVNKNAFSVDVNNKQEFELNADIPANAKGVFNVVVNAVAKNFPSIKSEKNLRLEVVSKYDCYKADVIADSRIKNDYSNVYIPIKVRNSGIEKAEYEISLEAPSWISVEPKKLAVNPEQIGNMNLNINPDDEVAEGVYGVKIHAKFEDITYTKNIEVVLGKKQYLKNAKLFLNFYKYYLYITVIALAALFIFRRQISTSIKKSYKDYRHRKTRLKALEAARKARQIKSKKEAKAIEKAEFGVKKVNKYRRKWILFLTGLVGVILILSFSIYQFNFPVSKEFVKAYYTYFIAGVVISFFIIFMIERHNKKKK
ncbi:hypothetical protein HYX02_01335 [Candidatus Woesearchaeota archaeon]|nr:hypothetical protein [Candidatus Woesearchaeota archaeon]